MSSIKRKILHYPTAAKKGLKWRVVSPDDFSHSMSIAISKLEANKMMLTPYCFDFNEKQIIFTTGLGPLAAINSSFYYLKQREMATGFLAVPIETTPARIPQINIEPIILFSPGRCGSTLLSKIIDAIGITSVSEPDFYTQVTEYVVMHKPGREEMQHILHMLRFASYSLVEATANIERPVVLKMRSHANHAPNLVLAGFYNTKKTIFLTRDFQSWCESRMRAFTNTLESNFATYLQSLKALIWLQQNTECLVIRYEELKSDPQKIVSKLCKSFKMNTSIESFQQVLEKDSQEDTLLARSKLNKPLSPETIESIRNFWQEKAPHELLNKIKF